MILEGILLYTIPKRFRQFASKSLGSLDSNLYLLKISEKKCTQSSPWLVQSVVWVFSETSVHMIEFKKGLSLLMTFKFRVFTMTHFIDRVHLLHLILFFWPEISLAAELYTAYIYPIYLISLSHMRKRLQEPEGHAQHHLTSNGQDSVELNHCAFPTQ